MNAVLAKLNARIDTANTLACIGLDPLCDDASQLFSTCRDIVDATASFAAAFKPNVAFFEAHGSTGIAQLEAVAAYIHERHPEIVTICDAKRGDIGSTSAAYARAVFDTWGFDAVTLHPYTGAEGLAPFLARDDKAAVILCRTSNPGARELQDFDCAGTPLWQHVAELVSQHWDRGGNCWLVAGATYPEELSAIRSLAPHTPLLVPGIGAQGGDVRAVVAAGLDADRRGLLLSSSRAISAASDRAAAARALRDEINEARA